MPPLNWQQRLPWGQVGRGYSSLPAGATSPTYTDNTSVENSAEDGLLEKPRRRYSFDMPAPRPFWRNAWFLGGHALLLTVYISVLFLVAQNGAKGTVRDRGLPFSPAVKAVVYEDTIFSLEDKIQDRGRFSGKPSPDLDQAWHDLLNAENIVLEPEYMRHYDRENIGVAVPEGGGYIGTLNVYHELHCLKRIHQFMYPDYYFPELTERQHELNRLHNEHCIDFLRQSVMCHGDIGLITYEWHDDSLIPVANATSHQCVNWERLDRWTKERTVNMMKPGWLVHPTKGVAYPKGTGDNLGAVDNPDWHAGH